MPCSRLLSLVAVLALAGCGGTPPEATAPQPQGYSVQQYDGRYGGYDDGRYGGYDDGRYDGYGDGRYGGGRLYPVDVWASSRLRSGGRIYAANEGIDSSTDTEWASADWDRRPTYRLEFRGRPYIERIAIKTWQGARYRIRVLNDGGVPVWVSPVIYNSSWNVETKPVHRAGRYLEIAFIGDPPGARHQSIFHLQAFGDRRIGPYGNRPRPYPRY